MNTQNIYITNSLSREKEKFEPVTPGRVGLYVCGPTVYGPPHLGHARPYIFFDVVSRYFTHLGYKVRYVRNITDVGHLVDDADEGEDKIAKKARLEQLEPMEVVELYAEKFHDAFRALNIQHVSIEPRASLASLKQRFSKAWSESINSKFNVILSVNCVKPSNGLGQTSFCLMTPLTLVMYCTIDHPHANPL